MNTYIAIPKATEWQTITYHPKPFYVDYCGGGDKYLKEKETEGYTVEVVKEDIGYRLRKGIRVKLIPPSDLTEFYIEPLATMHKSFFNKLSEVLHTVYPWIKNRRIKNMTFRSDIHSIVADWYWDTIGQTWKKYTPTEWCELLNGMLTYIEENKLKNVEEIQFFIGNANKYLNRFIKKGD